MKKWLLGLILLLILLPVLGWFGFLRPVIQKEVRRQMEGRLSKLSGAAVRIETVRIHPFLKSITLTSINVKNKRDAVVFSCERIQADLNLLSFREGISGLISTVEMSRPSVSDASGPIAFLLMGPQNGIPRGPTVTWRDGALTVPKTERSPEVLIKEWAGTVHLREGEALFDMTGRSDLTGAVSLSGQAKTGAGWTVKLMAESIPMGELTSYLPAGLPVQDIQGRLQMETTVRQTPQNPKMEWVVRGLVMDGSCLIPKNSFRVSVDGAFELSEKSLLLNNMAVNDVIQLNGSCLDPLGKDPQLDMAVRGKNVPLSLINDLMGKKKKSFWLQGNISIQGHIRGPLHRPDIRLEFLSKGIGTPAGNLPSMRAFLRATPSQFRARAQLLGGTVALQGDISDHAVTLEGDVAGIDLSRWKAPHADASLGGTLNGSMKWSSRSRKADGTFRLSRFSAGPLHAAPELSGTFLSENGSLDVRSADGSIFFQMTNGRDDSVSTSFELRFSSDTALHGEGTVTPTEMAMSFSGEKIPLNGWSFMKIARGDWSGTFGISGELSGPRSNPVIRGSVFVPSATLDPTRRLTDIRVDFSREGGRFSVSRLKAGGGAWGKLLFKEADGVFQVTDRRIQVEEFKVSQKDGDLRLSGDFPIGTPDRAWALTATLHGFDAGGTVIDGDVRLAGPERGSLARIRSSGLTIDGYGTGAVDGSLDARQDVWTLDNLTLGTALSGRLTLNSKNQKIDVALALKPTPARELPFIGERFDNPLATGTVSGQITVGGTLENPLCSYSLKCDGGRWDQTPFDASVNGEWRDGRLYLARFSASLPDDGRLDGQGTIFGGADGPEMDVSIDFKNISFQKCLPTVWPKDWTGKSHGHLVCRGAIARPVVEGSLLSTSLAIAGWEFTTFSSRFEYRDRTFLVKELEARTADGLLRCRDGSRVLLTDEGVRFHVWSDMRNIQGGSLTLFGGLEADGEWRRVAGNPFVKMTLRGQSLWVNQHRMEGDIAHFTWDGDWIVLSPRPGAVQYVSGTIDLRKSPLLEIHDFTVWEKEKRRFWMDGTVGPDTLNLDVDLWEYEAKTLASLADLDFNVSGKVNAHVTCRGTPQKPVVKGEAAARAGRLGLMPYDLCRLKFAWSENVLNVTSLEAVRKSGYKISGNGSLPLPGPGDDSSFSQDPRNYSFRLKMDNGDLSILKDIWPDCKKARGSMQAELRVKPDEKGQPRLNGFLVVEDGLIKSQKYVRSVSDFDAQIILKNDKLSIKNCAARIGKGRLLLHGNITLKNFDIDEYDLAIETVGRDGIDVEVPELSVPPGPLLKRFSLLRESLGGVSHGSPHVYLRVQGPASQPSILGTVVLENARFTYPPSEKSTSKTPEDSWGNRFFQDAVWDLTLKAGDNTWYRNEFVNAQLTGSMDFKGPADALKVDGKLECRRGVISYLGQTFNINKTAFEVVTDTNSLNQASNITITPYLSGEAERSATTPDPRGVLTPDTILMVINRAPLGEIQPRFISRNNPGLSSERVAQMALGITQDQFTAYDRDQLLRAGLVQLLGSTAGPFANNIAHRFGIDILYPTYAPSESESTTATNATGSPVGAQRTYMTNLLKGAGASAGIQLSNRIFGMYKFKMDEYQNQTYFRDEVEIVYKIQGNLHIRASTELDSRRLLGQAPDRRAILENQWRFGLPKKKKTEPKASSQKADARNDKGKRKKMTRRPTTIASDRIPL
ncbi:MAG TPA: translocation/assembly module TamB domain-containing protein [Elusimicrobiota bacterium]|nr:translocation/assembly module TamB domain-containing protein [Elusimicrobiota bacterium]